MFDRRHPVMLLDENPKIGQIQAKGPMEKDEGSSGEGQSPRVEKDEGLEAETLSRLLIVAEGPN